MTVVKSTLEVVCAGCGSQLRHSIWNRKGQQAIRVSPCKACERSAREEENERGFNEGVRSVVGD